MVLLNFGFTGIQVSRGKTTRGKLNVKSGLNVTDVLVSKSMQQKEQTPFQITFSYHATYSPSNGFIKLDGELLYLANEKAAKEIQESWSKNKTLPKDFALPLYNKILHNCTIEALVLSREVGLPAPMQLPKLASQKTMPTKETDKPVQKTTPASKKTATATKKGSTKK